MAAAPRAPLEEGRQMQVADIEMSFNSSDLAIAWSPPSPASDLTIAWNPLSQPATSQFLGILPRSQRPHNCLESSFGSQRSMATLFTLPRELRDSILRHAIFSADGALATPSIVAADRTQKANGQVVFYPQAPPRVNAASLLLTSKLLRAETQDRNLTYVIDVMFVKTSGLWPTWLSIPRLATHVDTLHASFRIKDLPEDMAPTFRRKNWWRGGDGGPPAAVWSFYWLLVGFLECGPVSLKLPTGSSTARFSIARLVIDVQLAEEGEDHGVLESEHGRHEHYMFGRGMWFVARREDGVLEKVRTLEETDPRRLPAEKLARFMGGELLMLLGLGRHSYGYGRVLYECIGVLEVRVDGDVRILMDLGELFDLFPAGSEDDREMQHTWTPAFAAWKKETMALRKERGLDEVKGRPARSFSAYSEMQPPEYPIA
ncbi:hypothetical protein ACHAQH_009381 [Verticillium albo-atrum]